MESSVGRTAWRVFCSVKLKVLLAYEGGMDVVRELNIPCHKGHGGSIKGPGW